MTSPPASAASQRALLREIIEVERDLARLIWLLNINDRASAEAEKVWKRCERKLQRMTR